MSSFVLDASAILAVIFAERGAEVVVPALRDAVTSAVNLSEVVGKMTEQGANAFEVQSKLHDIGIEAVPFDTEQALRAGLMHEQTRRSGLSLADRACLTLATILRQPVMTADRVWAQLDLGVEVRLIR